MAMLITQDEIEKLNKLARDLNDKEPDSALWQVICILMTLTQSGLD